METPRYGDRQCTGLCQSEDRTELAKPEQENVENIEFLSIKSASILSRIKSIRAPSRVQPTRTPSRIKSTRTPSIAESTDRYFNISAFKKRLELIFIPFIQKAILVANEKAKDVHFYMARIVLKNTETKIEKHLNKWHAEIVLDILKKLEIDKQIKSPQRFVSFEFDEPTGLKNINLTRITVKYNDSYKEFQNSEKGKLQARCFWMDAEQYFTGDYWKTKTAYNAFKETTPSFFTRIVINPTINDSIQKKYDVLRSYCDTNLASNPPNEKRTT